MSENDYPVRPDTLCTSTLPRRYGSAQCDLEVEHKGLHIQFITNIMWSTERAAMAWEADDV